MDSENKNIDLFSPAVLLWESRQDVCFDDLISVVKDIHLQSYHAAVKAVNRYATMRNWLIGFFIVEYQQKGRDRAAYGEKLLKSLEESLRTRGLNVTLFQNSRLLYILYPQLCDLFQINIQPALSVKSTSIEIQHEYLGQLNAYVSYYKENEMHEGDNPPVGILLCTKAGKKMVEYALAGMDNSLFVSTYLLQLPDKTILEQFIKDNNKESI